MMAAVIPAMMIPRGINYPKTINAIADHKDTGGIAGHSQIGSMSQGRQPGIPQNEVQAYGKDAEDKNFGQHA